MATLGTHRPAALVVSTLLIAAFIVAGMPAAMRAVAPASVGPTVTAPLVGIRHLGQLGKAAIPLKVSWPIGAPDGSPIARYELEISRDSGPWSAISLPRPRARSVVVKTRAWSVIRFRVRAVDQASTAGDWAESTPVWPTTAQENDAGVALSAGWQILARSKAFGGHRAVTTGAGEVATFDFTGRAVGWVARLGPNAGTASVSVDGGPATSVDLHRASGSNRRVVYSAAWPTVAHHVLTLTTTTGTANVDVDAFVVLSDPADATLVGAGDIAVCGETNLADEQTGAVVEGVGGTVFTAGDNVYPQGDAQNYIDCYGPSWGAFKDRTRPAPGNHDYYNNPGAAAYFAYFGAAAGDPAKGWYRYDAGTWRVYALNSECSGSECTAQYDSLRADLTAEPHRCVMAIWHRPLLSTGPHGDSTKMAAVFQLLYDNGAEVVITGHDHMYERYTPVTPGGVADPVAGIREFVVGTGGASLYGFSTDSPLVEVRDNTSHGVLRLDLTPGGYAWQFLAAGTDTFTDSGTTSCH